MFFQKRTMASEDVKSYNRSVIYTVGGTATEITNGAVVKLLSPATNIFGTSDMTTYLAATPAADTDSVYVLDIVESPYATSGTLNFRVLENVTDLKAPAGTAVRARKLKIDDTFLLGSDNFASAPTVGQYAIPTAASKLWTPAGASVVTTKVCILIESAVTVGVGVSGSLSAYRCRCVTSI